MDNESIEKTWYLADILEAFKVAGEEDELLYINAILVHATDAEEAEEVRLATAGSGRRRGARRRDDVDAGRGAAGLHGRRHAARDDHRVGDAS